ncbi:hypothetical protein VTK26DRAFT_5786 [Humicola hyalothermophila]
MESQKLRIRLRHRSLVVIMPRRNLELRILLRRPGSQARKAVSPSWERPLGGTRTEPCNLSQRLYVDTSTSMCRFKDQAADTVWVLAKLLKPVASNANNVKLSLWENQYPMHKATQWKYLVKNHTFSDRVATKGMAMANWTVRAAAQDTYTAFKNFWQDELIEIWDLRVGEERFCESPTPETGGHRRSSSRTTDSYAENSLRSLNKSTTL